VRFAWLFAAVLFALFCFPYAVAQDDDSGEYAHPTRGVRTVDGWEVWFYPRATSAGAWWEANRDTPFWWFPIWRSEPYAMQPFEWVGGFAQSYEAGYPSDYPPHAYGGGFSPQYRGMWGGGAPLNLGSGQPALPAGYWGLQQIVGAGAAQWGAGAGIAAQRMVPFRFSKRPQPPNASLFGGTYDAYGGWVALTAPTSCFAASSFGSNIWAAHYPDPRTEFYTATGAVNFELSKSGATLTPWMFLSSQHFSWQPFQSYWHRITNIFGAVLGVPTGEDGVFFFRPGWVEEADTSLGMVQGARGLFSRLGWRGLIAGRRDTALVLFETYLDCSFKDVLYNNGFGTVLRSDITNYDLFLQKLVVYKSVVARLGGRLHNTSWSGDVDSPYKSLFLPFAAVLLHLVPKKVDMSCEWSRTIGIPTLSQANSGSHEEHIQNITTSATVHATPNLAAVISYTHQHLTDAIRWGVNFGTQRADITIAQLIYQHNGEFLSVFYTHASRRDWNATNLIFTPRDYGGFSVGFKRKKFLFAVNLVAHANYFGVSKWRWHRTWFIVGFAFSEGFQMLARVDVMFRQRGDRRLYLDDHLVYIGAVISF